MRNPKLVPYETIVRATSGEQEAVDEVLRHYSKRIRLASLESGQYDRIGGGLTPKNEWRDNGTEFFLPVKAVSKVFRGKYMDELKNLWKSEKLSFCGTAEKYRNHYTFKELLDAC